LVKCLTCKTNSNEYDFEAKEVIKSSKYFTKRNSYFILRNGEFRFITINKKLLTKDFVLFKIKCNENNFYLNSNLILRENPKYKDNNINKINWDNMAWLIVKDLKQKNFKNVKNKKQIIIIN